MEIASVLAQATPASETVKKDKRAIALGLPINCQLGDDCFILLYPDVDPRNRMQDAGCGGQTYDTHKGTDFGIANLAEMERGVNVLSVADGTVLRLRDGVPDRRLRNTAELEEVAADGIECGNGMVVDHGDGWEGQYCHLRQGSIGVAPGDRVLRGDTLGQVGVSGKTTFPHVHLTLRHNGEAIDPLSGQPITEGCGRKGEPLWIDPTARTYEPTGIVSLGFSDTPPTLDALWDGEFDGVSIDTNADVILFWAHHYGVQAGDIGHYRLIDSAGNIITDYEQPIESDAINGFSYVGKRNTPDRPILPGTWRGEYRILRDGQTIDSDRVEFEVLPAR